MEVVYGTATKLVELLGSTAYEEISLAWGVNEELKKLRKTLSIIHAVLLDAEERQTHSEQIKTWLTTLKDVLVDAEVLLDEFECEDLRNKVVKKHGTIGRKVRRLFSRSNPLVFRNRFGHKMKDIQKELHKIAALRTEFGLEEGHRKLITRETQSYLSSLDLVIGRDAEKERIIELLLEQSDSLSVIPMQGMLKCKLVLSPRIKTQSIKVQPMKSSTSIHLHSMNLSTNPPNSNSTESWKKKSCAAEMVEEKME